jgi:hypothetical protein
MALLELWSRLKEGTEDCSFPPSRPAGCGEKTEPIFHSLGALKNYNENCFLNLKFLSYLIIFL